MLIFDAVGLQIRPSGEKDSQPVNDIAHRLLLETNTVTPHLQRMEKLGIVTRRKGKQDKRQQIVSLTEKGRQMEQQAYDIIPKGMGERFVACPLSMDDFRQLAGGLDGIIETLKPTKFQDSDKLSEEARQHVG